MTYDHNPQLQLAYNFIQYTNKHLFLTGKAGTGKTTFLKTLKKSSPKRMVVVAPTGVAAINAGGVTIHSFFQLPFGPQIPKDVNSGFKVAPSVTGGNERVNRFSKNKINIIRSLDLLVIDEISMVRADVLDAIDDTLRQFRNRYQPFGGIQLLMIGDLQQLAPVIKEDDWKVLGKYYKTGFFFSSHALQKSEFIGIELKHIYRQNEQEFINLLNKIRNNKLNEADLRLLNSRYIPAFSPSEEEGYITLTTHNYQAKNINLAHLKKINSKLHRFTCKVEGEFPEYSYPAEEVLEIKTGSQVMFLKNDTVEKKYYNGKIGKVANIIDDLIEVICPGETYPIQVEPVFWENTRYNLNELNGEIEEEAIGKFTQYPLKLAWAITIHKSQGLTFEKAIIDASQSFAHGQVYVALSRCKSIGGLVLSNLLNTQSVINDETVTGFTTQVEQNHPDQKALEKHRKNYELHLLNELFGFNPLINSISYLQKICEENASSLIGNLHSELQNLMKPFREEVVDVADKFRMQIEKLSASNSASGDGAILQQRLQKAADYFLVKLNEKLEIPLARANFECDNKSVRKRIHELIKRIDTDTGIKKACLQSVRESFSIREYLEARAKASIEGPKFRDSRQKIDTKMVNHDFYHKLKAWRKEKSEETGIEESKILHQKVMIEIAIKLPPTIAELKAVKGMGGQKMKLFGQQILAFVLNYRQEKKMDIPENAREEVELASLSTKEITLKLFKQGIKLPEIAKKRGLTGSTIESHLAHFVSNGIIDIFDLIDKEKYDNIHKSLLEKNPQETVGDIRLKLGNEYTYTEIRLVMADIFKQRV